MDFSLINLTLKQNKKLADMLALTDITEDAFNYFYNVKTKNNVTYYTLKNDLTKIIHLEDVSSDKRFITPAFDLIDELKNKKSNYGLMSIRDWSANGLTEIKQKLKNAESNEGKFYLDNVDQYDQIITAIKSSYSKYFNLGVEKEGPLKERYRNASKFKVGYVSKFAGRQDGAAVARRQLPTAKGPKNKMKNDAPATYNKYALKWKKFIEPITGKDFDGTNNLETAFKSLNDKYNEFIATNKKFFDDLYLNNDASNRLAVSSSSQSQYKNRMIAMLDKQQEIYKEFLSINQNVAFDKNVSDSKIQRVIKEIDNRKKIIDLRLEATHKTQQQVDDGDKEPDIKAVNFLKGGAKNEEKQKLIDDLEDDKSLLIGILNELNKTLPPPAKTEYNNFKKQIQDQINRTDQFIKDIKNMSSQDLINAYKFKQVTNTDRAILKRKTQPQPAVVRQVEAAESKTQDTPLDSIVQNPSQVQTNVAPQQPPQTQTVQAVQPPPAASVPTAPTSSTAPNNAPVGSGIVEELRNYLKRYQELPFYSKTDEANKLQTELQQALATDRTGKFIRPDKINQEELRKHRDYFAKNIGIAGKTKDQLKSNQEKEQAKDMIDQAVRDAKAQDIREKEEEKDIKLKELRPDINEGKDLYEGIDKGEKELNNQSQFLKKQVQIKDEEIKLLKQKLDEKRNQDFNSQLSGIAPVFRNLLNIQIGDIFAEDYTDYIDSIF